MSPSNRSFITNWSSENEKFVEDEYVNEHNLINDLK